MIDLPEPDLLNRAAADYPKMHALVCTLIERSALEVLLESEPWKKSGQVLAIKLVQHLHTLLRTSEPTRLVHPHLDIGFVDFGSVNVLIRAAIETFIVYAYIYKCDDPTLSKFRHDTWELGGMNDRQHLIPLNPEESEKLAKEKDRINHLATAILASPHLVESKKKLLLKGEWRAGASWQALGSEAGLHKRWIAHVYKHLSNYAHTSFLSVLQMGQAPIDDQKWMASLGLTLGLEIMAHFVVLFASTRRSATKYLAENEDAQKLVKLWRLTADEYDGVYNPPPAPAPIPTWRPGDVIRRFPEWMSSATPIHFGQTLRWAQQVELSKRYRQGRTFR